MNEKIIPGTDAAILAKMGDLWGHKRILLVSTLVTALASWGVAVAPSFATLLVAWGLQGAYAVWLPLEVAIIYLTARRAGAVDAPADTRRAAGVLVFALEAGVIAGALAGGALVDVLPFGVVLALPAVAVTLSLDGAGLRVAVRDDGPGGADPHGSGIAGLRGRVEALDGRLGVSSPPGAGTTIEAELPC